MTDSDYYTVLFGLARCSGIAAQIVDERTNLRYVAKKDKWTAVPIYRCKYVLKLLMQRFIMKLHEYQAKALIGKRRRVAVPPGFAAESVEEAVAAAEKLGGELLGGQSTSSCWWTRKRGAFKGVATQEELEKVVQGIPVEGGIGGVALCRKPSSRVRRSCYKQCWVTYWLPSKPVWVVSRSTPFMLPLVLTLNVRFTRQFFLIVKTSKIF